MTNKYLTKVCALLRPPVKTTQPDPKPVKHNKKINKYTAKIKKRIHNGDTSYRTHKVK